MSVQHMFGCWTRGWVVVSVWRGDDDRLVAVVIGSTTTNMGGINLLGVWNVWWAKIV